MIYRSFLVPTTNAFQSTSTLLTTSTTVKDTAHRYASRPGTAMASSRSPEEVMSYDNHSLLNRRAAVQNERRQRRRSRRMLRKQVLAQRNRLRSAKEATRQDAHSLLRSRSAIRIERRHRQKHRSLLKKQSPGFQEESKSKSIESVEKPSKPQICDDPQVLQHISVAEKQRVLKQASWTRLMIAPVKEWLEVSESVQSDLSLSASSLEDQQSNQNASVDPSFTQKQDLLDQASFTQLMLAPIKSWFLELPESTNQGVNNDLVPIVEANAETDAIFSRMPEAQIDTTTLQQSYTLRTSEANSNVSSARIESMKPQPTRSTSSLTHYAYGGDVAPQQQATNAHSITLAKPIIKRMFSKATSVPTSSNTANAHTTYQDLVSRLTRNGSVSVGAESGASDSDTESEVQSDTERMNQTFAELPDLATIAVQKVDRSNHERSTDMQSASQISQLDQTNMPSVHSTFTASNGSHDTRSVVDDEPTMLDDNQRERSPSDAEMLDEDVYHTSSEGNGRSPMNDTASRSSSKEIDIVESSKYEADRARALIEAYDVSFEDAGSTDAKSTEDEQDTSSFSMYDTIVVVDRRQSIAQNNGSLSTSADMATYERSSNDTSESIHSPEQVFDSDGTRNTVYSNDQSSTVRIVDSDEHIEPLKEHTGSKECSIIEDPSSTMFSEDATESQLFETINEVSCEVFGLTRSLDETWDSMTTKRNNLVSKLRKSNTGSNVLRYDAQEKWFEQNILPSSPTVLTCNVVLTSDPPRDANEDVTTLGYDDDQPSFNSSLQYNRDLGSTSPLSELSRTPTPPTSHTPVHTGSNSITKRKTTGIVSKHFSKRQKRGDLGVSRTVLENDSASQSSSLESCGSDDEFTLGKEDTQQSSKKSTVRRAGTSNHRFPPISSSKFGLLQEKLWQEPFWLIIGVTFLNKTAGRVAAPIFWELKRRYPTSEDLADANEKDLHDLVRHLGLQTQRSRRLIKIAKAWSASPPVKAKRYRTLHYPVKNDGKEFKKEEAIEGDVDDCAGALEIGHIPGCGPYAWDSWRIFCRDALREVAEDFNGSGDNSDFEPEWKRVVPLDKELRACLRWMWLREGYVWNPETGEKREVTEDERLSAIKGELEPVDEAEAHFTAEARKDVYNTTIPENDE